MELNSTSFTGCRWSTRRANNPHIYNWCPLRNKSKSWNLTLTLKYRSHSLTVALTWKRIKARRTVSSTSNPWCQTRTLCPRSNRTSTRIRTCQNRCLRTTTTTCTTTTTSQTTCTSKSTSRGWRCRKRRSTERIFKYAWVLWSTERTSTFRTASLKR